MTNKQLPSHCKCAPSTWQANPPPICDHFVELWDIEGNIVEDTCANCLHDMACHTNPPKEHNK